MSAPDEIRQLADDVDVPVQIPDDWQIKVPAWKLHAAAVALRHHADLTESIGDPEDAAERLHTIADFYKMLAPLLDDLGRRAAFNGNAAWLNRLAAAVSPPPAPTTCPTCRSVDPDIVGYMLSPAPCPDSWHQE